MRVAYLGNFGPAHSTETHVARSLESLGHEVTRIQEGETRVVDVVDRVAGHDLMLWTQTYGLAVTGGTIPERFTMLDEVRNLGIPTVGYHLDRWWGLDRADQLPIEPFFRCDVVCTADGGHEQQWKDLGINHRWFPPAVADFECGPATAQPRLASDIAFVGSWQSYGHTEWKHRGQLVEFLRHSYGTRCKFWPLPGRHAVRGELLRVLYASVKILVGDSCLIPNTDGTPCIKYLSDRIPETLGRGGFLIHPAVEGVTDGTQYTDGEHLVTWPLDDWGALRDRIDRYLRDDDERNRIATAGRAHVLEHHTYVVRMRQLAEMLIDDGYLPGVTSVA